MEETLRALGSLILQAVPTFLCIWILYVYLRVVYFKPLERTLEERRKATEGARQLAEQSLEKASQKASEYEEAIRAARAAIFKEQEAFRQQMRQEHAEAASEARKRAQAQVKEASAAMEAELASARAKLQAEAGVLSDTVVETILRRRTA